MQTLCLHANEPQGLQFPDRYLQVDSYTAASNLLEIMLWIARYLTQTISSPLRCTCAIVLKQGAYWKLFIFNCTNFYYTGCSFYNTVRRKKLDARIVRIQRIYSPNLSLSIQGIPLTNSTVNILVFKPVCTWILKTPLMTKRW